MSIDDRPLPYGKWKNSSPNQLYDRGEYGYLKWLYENTGYQVMSDDLYKKIVEDEDNGAEEYWKL